MGIKAILNLLTRMDIPKFVHYNFFSKKVVRHGKGYIIPFRHSVIDMATDARINIYDGNLRVNHWLPKGSKVEAYIRMRKGSVLNIKNTVLLNYKSTIELGKNAEITIGSAKINSGAIILAAEKIDIGDDVLISREVFIFDADHHPILDQDGNQTNPPKPVVIEDHVWIGLKCTLLRGSHIGTGAIIAAGSVVGGKIKPGTMASGNPARSYSEVKWRDHL